MRWKDEEIDNYVVGMKAQGRCVINIQKFRVDTDA